LLVLLALSLFPPLLQSTLRGNVSSPDRRKGPLANPRIPSLVQLEATEVLVEGTGMLRQSQVVGAGGVLPIITGRRKSMECCCSLF